MCGVPCAPPNPQSLLLSRYPASPRKQRTDPSTFTANPMHRCGNNNFAKRTECNKCKTPRSMAEAVGGGGGTVGGMGGPPAAPPPPPMMGGAGPALGGMAAAGGDVGGMMAQRPAPAGPPPREGDWTCVG